jgi:hypothetical protein
MADTSASSEILLSAAVATGFYFKYVARRSPD